MNQKLLGQVTEDTFKDNVIQIAQLYGWMVAHFRPARTDKGWRTAMQGDKGYPDLTLAKNGYVLFVELKSETGKLSPEQGKWGTAIRGEGEGSHHRYFVWRPRDMDRIRETLKMPRF